MTSHHLRILLFVGAILPLLAACSRQPSPLVEPPTVEATAAAATHEASTPESPSGITGEVINLKLKVEDGRQYRMEMFKDQLSEVTIMGQTIPTRRVEVIEGTWEILATNVYRDFFNARFTFDRVRFAEFGNKGDVAFDSDMDDDPPLLDRAILLAGLLGHGIDVTITPSGRIVDVRDTGEMRDAILAALGENPDLTDRQAVERAHREALTDESLSLLLETFFATLPGTDFRVGDHWTELRPLTEVRSVNERRIHIVERNDDTITVQRESSMRPVREGVTMGRRVSDQLAFEIESGTFSTKAIVDRHSGWVREAHTRGETRSKLLMRAMQVSELPPPPMVTRETVIVRLLGDGVEPTRNIEVGGDVK